MAYEFKCSTQFWEDLEALTPENRRAAEEAFRVFKLNPLGYPGVHIIHRLSSIMKRCVRAAHVKGKGDLIFLFIVEGNTITSIRIGTHDIYR